MNYSPITAVGIDVSKSKSTVAVRRPGGEVVKLPFDVHHNAVELQRLVSLLQAIGGDIKIVMEHTGMYYYQLSQARLLYKIFFESKHIFCISYIFESVRILFGMKVRLPK